MLKRKREARAEAHVSQGSRQLRNLGEQWGEKQPFAYVPREKGKRSVEGQETEMRYRT